MREIGFGEKKYPLYWDIYAHDNILRACAGAGYSTLGDWMTEKKPEAHGVILYELMCGGIRRHNFEVSMGFKGGEKLPMPDIAPRVVANKQIKEKNRYVIKRLINNS